MGIRYVSLTSMPVGTSAPKRVWGETSNVTDTTPDRLGALCMVPWCSKHARMSWVWLALAVSVTFMGYVTRAISVW